MSINKPRALRGVFDWQRVDPEGILPYNKSMLFANIRQAVTRVARSHVFVMAMLVAVSSVLFTLSTVVPASAACDLNNMSITTGADCARGNGQPAQLVGDGGIFNRITSILLFIVGAVAVVMLIFGGIRYIVSGGDQANVTAAKNTILYAIIGIIVALLAYAAVKFVTGSLLVGIG